MAPTSARRAVRGIHQAHDPARLQRTSRTSSQRRTSTPSKGTSTTSRSSRPTASLRSGDSSSTRLFALHTSRQSTTCPCRLHAVFRGWILLTMDASRRPGRRSPSSPSRRRLTTSACRT